MLNRDFKLLMNRSFPPFHPTALFSAGEKGFFYDISDATTLFQDAAATIPATANDHPIRRINDLSPNGSHAIGTSDLTRPLLKINGGQRWVQPDGTDDHLDVTVAITGDDLTAFAAARTLIDAASKRIFSLGAAATADWNNSIYAAALFTNTGGFGAFRVAAKASQAIAVNTDTVIISIFDGANHILRLDSIESAGVASTGAFSISVGRLFDHVASVGADAWNGRFYAGGVIDRVLTTSEKAQLITWLAAKQGRVA